MTDYPANLTLRPIVAWPGPETEYRIRAPFRAPWPDTLDRLTTELRFLGGLRSPDTVLQVALREQDFRLDGMPRANARPTHPGVILSVESTKGPLSFPCDRFDDWRDNLRAIALALESLRRVDRYGITRNAEQYTGWRAIESAATSGIFTSDEAEEYLRSTFETEPAEPLRKVVRRARVLVHPDNLAGRPDQAAKVDAAVQVLEKARRL